MKHPIDLGYGVMARYGPKRLRVFPDGWGDTAYVDQLSNPELMLQAPPQVSIDWKSTEALPDRIVRDGTFAAITDLPKQAATVRVRLVEPATGTDRLCLLMAAWNDHGYSTRQLLAGELLARGIGSLILEIPFYGSRRLVGPDEQPIRTVADFARMGLGAATEGKALLHHFRDEYVMGVSGYSMGGNIGALVGAAAGFPVAMAPLAASHSPGPVFLDGVIRHGIDWNALGGREQQEQLRSALTAASALGLPAPAWSHSAVMVIGRTDGFIPLQAAQALHAHWPGSELRMVRGGHATVLWRQRNRLADAVEDSFSLLASSPSA